ncbi:protein of unknown function [Ruminococcaceae bacterium YRB3002]|nr:protein of unknown function [Ruminococcaceae bacterium YRB3002]
MGYLSKSKYCSLWQCPKIAWLRQNKPEAATIDDMLQARFEAGNMVADLAMGLFGDYTEVTVCDGDRLDLKQMIYNTSAEMDKGTDNICEASFSYNGLYCAVDILRKNGDGWAIYEVKSSTMHKKDDGTYEDDREIYIADISYQKYVLEHCGIKVTGTYLVYLNGDYIYDGNLDLSKLFIISDVAEEIDQEILRIEPNLRIAEQVLASDNEPDIDLDVHCKKPYECSFWKYCSRHIPAESVFNIYRLEMSKKIEYYRNGWVTYRELLDNAPIKNEKQLRQIEFALEDKGTYVNRTEIASFLNTLSYPLYFLDFETIQPVIPEFTGTRPYAQIPFQYSLHYIEHEGGELKHKEFLAESGTDPRRTIAESLCKDIPMNVCVTAYNKAFECTRIKELAETFPDLADHLLNIRGNIIDLLVPFQSGWYYNRTMGGSFSIKSVLPALFPDDPSLDYHNLEGVHHGGEAMTLFPRIKDMPPEEQKTARNNLLAYCKLDTYAMVKVWEELVRAAQGSIC